MKKNKPLTNASNSATSDIPNFWDRGMFDMKVKVRTKEKCPVCNSNFILTPTALVCPQHDKIKPNTYFLDWSYLGRRFKSYGYTTFKDAFLKAASIQNDIESYKFKADNYRGSTQANKRFSFEERFEKWAEFKKKTRKPGYYRKIRQYKGEFVKFFKNEDVRLIGTVMILQFYESMLGKVKEKTQYNKLGILRSFFNDLYEREVISTVPRFPKVKVPKKIPHWIDKDIQIKILQAIPKKHRPIFKFMFGTGVRHSEARALQWEDVDFKTMTLTIRNNFSHNVFTTTKDNEERPVPMTKEIADLLQGLPRTLRCNFVFTLNGKHYYANSLGNIWRKACADVGVEGITPYAGTRHSFASQLVNKGKSIEIIGAILGHADLRTTQKYAHVKLDAMRRAMED